MDSYEATRIVLSRIQKLDPENATKIIGSLLIQDHGEKEMIRLAFGPESLLHSVILKARKDLGLFSSNNGPLSPSAPCSPLPFSRQSSTNTRVFNGVGLPSPLSIPNPSAVSWAAETNFPEGVISPSSFTSHYSSPNGMRSIGVKSCFSSTMNSSALPFYGSGDHSDVLDEFQVPFLSSSPDGNVDSMLFNSTWSGINHRRGCSASDVCLNSEDPSGGFGWKPCLYFAKGYCKNGANCRFVHGHGMTDSDGISNMEGSPNNLDMMEQCQEFLGSNSAQQQRFTAASHLMSGGSGFAYSPRAAVALIIGDEMNKFSRSPRFERSEFAMLSPGSRQIYLTFPADSTFREEDVSNYFSTYGPVQDVRIPYQQKRMFGFVTFVYPETVKLILTKGNPHFICDARVLVKPYKEKGKVPEKFRRLQNMERGDFLSTGLDSRDPFDMQFGARMFSSNQDQLWRKNLEEQADLEHAIEMQNRRLVGLRLLNMKTNHHRAFSTDADTPTHSPNLSQQSYFVSSNCSSPDFPEENAPKNSVVTNVNHSANETEQDRDSPSDKNSNGKESLEDLDLQLESMVNSLPEHLFASPKAAGEYTSTFSMDPSEPSVETICTTSSPSSANLMTLSLLPASSTLDVASLKSCYFQSPRLANNQGAIRM